MAFTVSMMAAFAFIAEIPLPALHLYFRVHGRQSRGQITCLLFESYTKLLIEMTVVVS